MTLVRRTVFALLAGALLLTTAPAAAQTTPEAIIGSIDAYWAQEFAARGIPYRSPRIEAVSGPTPSACGELDVWIAPGAYCPADGTIYYVPEFFTFAARAVGEFTTVIAHEWGHHIQAQLGLDVDPALYELQADCLGGAYLGAAEEADALSPGDAAAGLGLSQIAGSAIHGPGNLRAISFIGGYQDGPAACGIGF